MKKLLLILNIVLLTAVAAGIWACLFLRNYNKTEIKLISYTDYPEYVNPYEHDLANDQFQLITDNSYADVKPNCFDKYEWSVLYSQETGISSDFHFGGWIKHNQADCIQNGWLNVTEWPFHSVFSPRLEGEFSIILGNDRPAVLFSSQGICRYQNKQVPAGLTLSIGEKITLVRKQTGEGIPLRFNESHSEIVHLNIKIYYLDDSCLYVFLLNGDCLCAFRDFHWYGSFDVLQGVFKEIKYRGQVHRQYGGANY